MNQDHRRLAVLVASLCGVLALAGAAAWWQAHRNRTEASERFDALAEHVATEVSTRMQTYEYGLRGARGVELTAPGQHAQREAFARYAASRDIKTEFPGARGYGLIRRVPQAHESAFVAAARRDGWPNFSVRQLEPHAGERYVIEFVEPIDNNSQAVGLDVASEANRRQAAEAAMRSGQATLTGPITLVQASGAPARAFMLLLPIYRPGAAVATAAEREAAAIGWSFAPLVIDDVLKGLQHDTRLYALSLRDVAGADTHTFYATPHSATDATIGLQQRRSLAIFGRTWQAELRATPAFVQSLRQPRPASTALAAATLGAMALALLALWLRLARGKESQRQEQARRAAIVDASDDAVIGATPTGIVTDWNGGAERLFGFVAAEALGRRMTELLLPSERTTEGNTILAQLARGERVATFETTRMHRDGRLIDVAITASPILGRDGRCIGIAKTVRDIGATQRARQALAELNATLEAQVSERAAQLATAQHDLRSILDALPSVVGYCDSHLHIRFANLACGSWFGIDQARIQGLHIRDVVGARYELGLPYMQAALRGEAQTFERSITTPGRGERHALGHYVPDVVAGEVRGFYVLMHDVTELVEGRLKLAAVQRDHEALYGIVQQHTLVTASDPSGRITAVNDAFCALAGYGRDELIGQPYRLFHAAQHDGAFQAELAQCLAQDRMAWRGEIAIRAKDGSTHWAFTIIAPIVSGDGTVEGYRSIGNDITAAKLAEQRLRSSEAFLDRVGQIAGVGGWEVDLRTRTLLWSDQTRRIHEVEPDYVPTMDAAIDFYAPQARPVIEAAVRQGIEHGTPWDLELPFVTALGRAIWVRAVGTAEFAGATPVRLVGAFQDVTERRLAQSNLAYERQLMSALLETLPDQIYFKDRDSRFLRINPALARRFGLDDAAAAVGKSDVDFFNAEHATRTAAIERGIVDSGQAVIDLEEQETWLDRAPTWNLATKMPLHDAEGQVIGTFGISRDISARKQMEAELRQTMALLHAVLDSATHSAIVAVKPDGMVSVFNSGAQKMLGYRSDEVVGRVKSLIFHDPDELRRHAQALSAQLGRKVHAGKVIVEPTMLGEAREWSYCRKDGGVVPVSLAVTAMRDSEGQLFGYLGIAHDISRQKAAERSLREAVHRANQANRAKSQFLANMSHEIRTPMNAVIGLAYLLERTRLDKEQASTLAKIKLASTALLGIINDVLDLSKIEASEMHIERAPFSPATLLTELAQLMSMQAEVKGIDFVVDVPRHLPEALQGDATRLRQVLTNLLANAIKFTQRGSVRLHVHKLPASADTVRLRFVAQDTGIGIGAESLPRLFSPFAQADTSTTRKFGGTGLGLSIVKQLVTLMGGEVGVSSHLGVGSEFWVELSFQICDPVLALPYATAPTSSGPGLRGVRVLVVDDSAINQEVAQRILELEGASVCTANNGQEAVDHLLAHAAEIDIVLMDVQMPVLDGHDATRRIRTGLGLNKLPVIALTAGVSSGEQQRAEAAGMNGVIGKPFDPAALVSCIRSHVAVDGSAAQGPILPRKLTSLACWPQIAGVDGQDVATRLGGDVALFRSMLKRLLRDFDDLGQTSVDTPALPRLAARLHNLKGSAGTLGAKRIARLAAKAEVASRAGAGALVAPLLAHLAKALQSLRHHATPALHEPAEEDTAVPQAQGSARLDLLALAQLQRQLRGSELSAIDGFAALTPQLRANMDSSAFANLREQIDNLQFDDAARTLEARL